MDNLFDEFSKSLAESVPRRESLRRLGAVFAGAVLSPLGVGTAWAGPEQTRAMPSANVARRSSSRNAWRPAGRATATPAASADPAGNTSAARPPLAAGCAATCCTTRTAGPAEITATPWGRPVAAVIAPISPPTSSTAEAAEGCAPHLLPTRSVACVSGTCVYDCVAGAIRCNGTCTSVDFDPDNCGACGNVCGGSTPYCSGGECSPCAPGGTLCGGVCTNLDFDNANCGACGVVCPDGYSCQGVCTPIDS